MSQRDWSQIRDLVDLQERMDRLLDYTNERSRSGRDDDLSQASDWVPLADIFETEAGLVIKLEVPEIDRREIDVRVTENRLVISGQRQMSDEASRENYYRIERSYGRFSRSFSLPETVDRERIEASYENGILRVTLPKRTDWTPRTVSVEVK
jgi:HSP20 family protein